MRKKEFALVIVILFFIIMGGLGKGLNENRISSEVKEKVGEFGGEARVFINLKESGNEDIKEEIVEDIGKEKVKFVFEDSISAIVNVGDIERLEQDKRIESVKSVGIRQVFLQDSVPQINASISYLLQINGINLTGIDQTICIIDSGVNYSHPDLGGCYGNNSIDSNCKIWGGWDYCADDANCSTNDWNPMDVNGHGTHVSGIAAANGTINGVAPQSRIVMLKVCNSTGSCYDDAIMSAIDWCVNNASVFNISVISMSLGGGSYTNYCNDDPLAPNINNAVGAGISVVIATGNDGYTAQIAAPACVQNATPVGAIQKDDLTIGYNRNSLLKLLAPGFNINSTYLSATGYSSLSGTSMATPHAAGAIAIIKQFLNLTGQSKTPKEIESILNNTGKRIYDSSNGLNFSRINIHEAIIFLDNANPNVTLSSPLNNSISSNSNQTFRCNATDLALKNATFYLWNSSGIFNISSESISGAAYNFEINISNMTRGNYAWNCFFYDEKGNGLFAASNFSLVIGGISVNLLSPLNGNYTNINETNFSCQALSETPYELSNTTFYLWNSSSLILNETKDVSGTSNTSAFNYTFRYEDNYKWNCLAVNNVSNSSFADANFTIVFDISKPEVNLISPAEGYSETGARTILFEYNVSDNFNISGCDLILNGASAASNLSRINNETNNFSYSVSVGSYNWGVNCTDLAGNVGNSSLRSFVINAVPVSTTSSGGGGGGIVNPSTYTISKEQASQGYTRELNKNDKIVFEIFDEGFVRRNLTVEQIGDNFVNLSIKDGPVYIMLGMGQGAKLNLTSPNYYNLYIKLESIANGKAKLTIQTINEMIIKEAIKDNVNEDVEAGGIRELFKEKDEVKKFDVERFIGISILAIGLIFFIWLIYVKSKKEIKKEVIKEVKEELKKKRLKSGRKDI